MSRATQILALAVVTLTAAAVVATAASAADGWRVASWSSDSARYPSVYVSGYQAVEARVRLTASRRMRVTIDTSIRCRSADYMRNVRRKLAPRSRWVAPHKPLILRYAATFAGASDCSFIVIAWGGGGRLSALMATR